MQLNLLLNKFLGLLNQVSELYQSLLTVLDKEKNAVIAANLEKLNEAGKIKDNLLLKLRILEEQRIHLSEQLADHLDRPLTELTLTKLSQWVQEPYAHQLKRCRSRLLTLLTKIQELNEHNKALFSHSIDLVKVSVNLLNNLMTLSPVYFRSGNIEHRNQTGKILYDEI